MATVVLLGLVANAMSLVVLTRPKIRETSFNQLLAVMCIVDSLFIFCNIMSCLQAFGIKHGSYNEISKWPYVSIVTKKSISGHLKIIRGVMDAFAQVWMCSSVLMIVALTFERHFAIRSPHRVRPFLQCCYLDFTTLFSIQYRIHIRTTEWWKHLSFYVVPVTVLSVIFNIPIFMNLQVSVFITSLLQGLEKLALSGDYCLQNKVNL